MPSDIVWEQYDIFFAAGGHACLIDYPDAKGLQGIGAKFYDAGGIVSAVCHGPAILPGIIDPKTGKSIIAGKKVTGFTTKGEEEKGVLEAIKSWNRPTIEEAVASAGATCEASYFFRPEDLFANHCFPDVSPPDPWGSFAIADGHIVTGVNPTSAYATAEEAVKAYKKS
ncbi:MAG: hypothetical protein AUG51_18310 [Acidobacteria bacterium 13_1_20CM_3_53_8]|nr:MAG: hypothetical protein AUG51_18310 [Acidobacteria bacterium 13_1_20CM_3_53_8]